MSVLASSILKTDLRITSISSELKEKQYASNLLAQCLDQVEVALTLQPDRVPDSQDSALSRSLQTHQSLCEALENTEEQDANMAKGNLDTQLKKQVINSFKNVLRCTKDVPGASDKIKQGCDTDLGTVEQLFFDNFKEVICNGLQRGKDEHALSKVTPFQAPKSEPLLDVKIEIITKKIRNIDAKIVSCKARIEELKTPMASEEPFKDEEYKLYFNTPQQINLQNELDQLTVQLNKLFLENRERERDVKEGTDIVEAEIEYIIEKFDEKMEVIQAELEMKEEELQRHEEEIKSLDKPLAELEGVYKEVLAKRDKQDMMMREEQKLLAAKTKAALIAQSWWRGYRVRKAIKNKDKKGKGKKGKGRKK